jgi:hypothetical protein
MKTRKEKEYLLTRYLGHPLLFTGSFLLLQLSNTPKADRNISYIKKQVVNPGPIMAIAILGIIVILGTWIKYKRRMENKWEAYLNIIGAVLITAAIKIQQVIDYRAKGPRISFFGEVSDYVNFFLAVFAGFFLLFNIFYRVYGWDELEWERREKRREERYRHLWN